MEGGEPPDRNYIILLSSATCYYSFLRCFERGLRAGRRILIHDLQTSNALRLAHQPAVVFYSTVRQRQGTI